MCEKCFEDIEPDEIAERGNAADAVLHDDEYLAFFRDGDGDIVVSARIRNDHLGEYLRAVYGYARQLNERLIELEVPQQTGKQNSKFSGH